jgi:hypothetical protein
MIPTECKMPDLSGCSAERLQGRSILHVFIGDPGVNQKERSYRRIFARLVDKALYEYGMARKAILAQLDEQERPVEEMASRGRELFILAFTDHFENCVNAINRALDLLEHMREAIGSRVPRQTRRILEAYSRFVPDVRNLFEHMDKEIRADPVVEGEPIMLCVGGEGDRAVIGRHEVGFKDVAQTLRKLHEIGKLLFENGPGELPPMTTPPADARTTVIEGTATISLRRVSANDA